MCNYEGMAKEMAELVNAETTATDAWRKVSKKCGLNDKQKEELARKYTDLFLP